MKMKYPYKPLGLDLHYTEDPLFWRSEGTERSNVVQETEESVIK